MSKDIKHVAWERIFDVLYAMRLAPRHQLEAAAKDVYALQLTTQPTEVAIRELALRHVIEVMRTRITERHGYDKHGDLDAIAALIQQPSALEALCMKVATEVFIHMPDNSEYLQSIVTKCLERSENVLKGVE